MLHRTRKAFTLLELIVVIVILGILALIAIPTFLSVITKSKNATAAETASALDHDAMALGAFDQSPANDGYVETILGATGVPAVGAPFVSVTASEVPAATVLYEAAGKYEVDLGNGGKACLTLSAVEGTSGAIVNGACA
jgi:prepilin-type N-terminal cleavage/methylation domain-containing protein